MTVENGPVIKRQPDATFHVDDRLGHAMLKSGEWGRVGINLRSAPGYRCQDCGHLGVFKDRCRCGSANLELEE